MPAVTVSRKNNTTPKVRRNQVTTGQVFAKIIKGDVSRKLYAALGSNGKHYSVNLQTGELASTTKETSQVAVVGTFKAKITRELDRSQYRQRLRNEVRNGELFMVKGDSSNKIYGHLGRLRDGKHMSFNMGSKDVASTQNGRSTVYVIGEYRLDAEVTQ